MKWVLQNKEILSYLSYQMIHLLLHLYLLAVYYSISSMMPNLFKDFCPMCDNFTWVTSLTNSFYLTVGSWNHTPLPKDALPSSRNTSWFAWWCKYYWKACQGTTEADHKWKRRQVGARVTCGKIRRVFCFNAKGIKECFWRSNPSRIGTTGGAKEKEVRNFVRKENNWFIRKL